MSELIVYAVVALIVFLVFSYIERHDPYDEVLVFFNALFSVFWVLFVPFLVITWLFGLIAKLVRKLP